MKRLDFRYLFRFSVRGFFELGLGSGLIIVFNFMGFLGFSGFFEFEVYTVGIVGWRGVETGTVNSVVSLFIYVLSFV